MVIGRVRLLIEAALIVTVCWLIERFVLETKEKFVLEQERVLEAVALHTYLEK